MLPFSRLQSHSSTAYLSRQTHDTVQLQTRRGFVRKGYWFLRALSRAGREGREVVDWKSLREGSLGHAGVEEGRRIEMHGNLKIVYENPHT